jgi:hypothetical protein
MVIMPKNEGCEYQGDIIFANKKRVSNIIEILNNLDKLNIEFDNLNSQLSKGDVDKVLQIVENIFFQQVDIDLIKALINLYSNSTNKNNLMQELKELYIAHATKGIEIAWYCFILKNTIN